MSLLPKELDYLEPVAKELAKIPPDDLNEDVDATELIAALRYRVKGLELRDAISQLTKDNEVLQKWIKEKKATEGAVFFISAYFLRPGPLARQLLAPPSVFSCEPTVSIELAPDWVVKEFPRRLDLFKKQTFCSIYILDKSDFDHHLRENNHREELQNSPKNPWANFGGWTRTQIKLGNSCGEKCVYSQQGKTNWKQVDYALEIPGGYVNIRLGRQNGKDFDETEFEQKFHTLKVIPPACCAS